MGKLRSLYYFAYGSNLSTLRLRRRVPSAHRLEVGHVPGYDVAFAKRGQDGSAKATLAEAPGRRAHGCIFLIDAAHRERLDQAEGLGAGYESLHVDVTTARGRIEAFSYIAADTHVDVQLQVYDWYAALVEVGADEHGLPPEVVSRYAGVQAIADPNPVRAADHWALVRAARSHGRTGAAKRRKGRGR